MVVPEGTYEVCSRTINAQASQPNSNAKWILNIKWQMCGIDVHMDANIGKRLSGLGNTLTSLTGEQETSFHEDGLDSDLTLASNSKGTIAARRATMHTSEPLPEFVYDTKLDPKQRWRLIEHLMNEQAKTIEDLKQAGASQGTVQAEEDILHELEAVLFRDFRLDIIKKIKRQGVKASALKDKFGLGHKPSYMRANTYNVPHRRGGHRPHLDPNRRLQSCVERSEEDLAMADLGPRSDRAYSLDIEAAKRMTLDQSYELLGPGEQEPSDVHFDLLPDDSPTESPMLPRLERAFPTEGLGSDSEEEGEEEEDLTYLKDAASR